MPAGRCPPPALACCCGCSGEATPPNTGRAAAAATSPRRTCGCGIVMAGDRPSPGRPKHGPIRPRAAMAAAALSRPPAVCAAAPPASPLCPWVGCSKPRRRKLAAGNTTSTRVEGPGARRLRSGGAKSDNAELDALRGSVAPLDHAGLAQRDEARLLQPQHLPPPGPGQGLLQGQQPAGGAGLQSEGGKASSIPLRHARLPPSDDDLGRPRRGTELGKPAIWCVWRSHRPSICSTRRRVA